MGENEMNIDEILKQAIESIKEFVQANLNVVGDLSEESGLSSEEIFKILYADSVSIGSIVCLYTTIQKKIAAKSHEMIERMNSEEAQRFMNFQLSEVRKHVKANPNDTGKLSDETGLSTDEILKVVYTDEKNFANVAKLYGAVQKIIMVRTKEIIARNKLDEETDELINKQYAEIKAFVKPNPNIVSDLSQESGLAADEIFRIVYTNAVIPIADLGYLYSAVQRLQHKKSQEIIDRNNVI